MSVTIKYPGLAESYWEKVSATAFGGEQEELLEHAIYIPLAPGDHVTVDEDGTVTGVELDPDTCVFDVSFYLPADLPPFTTPTPEHKSMRTVADVIHDWAERGIMVTRDTNYSARISSNKPALIDEALGNRYVQLSQMVRFPGMQLDFEYAIQHPDIGGDHEGPWA